MTDQIASITLRADVSDLKTASNELDKLGQAAAGAVDKADDKTVCFNEIKGMEAFFCQISPEPAPDLCKQVRGKFRYWRQAFQDQGSKI